MCTIAEKTRITENDNPNTAMNTCAKPTDKANANGTNHETSIKSSAGA